MPKIYSDFGNDAAGTDEVYEMYAANRERVKFCQKSGATVEIECPNCEAKAHPGLKFGGECDQAHLN